MAKKLTARSYADSVTWFREHGFDVLEAPATSNRVFLKKYNCSAAIEADASGNVRVFAWPGLLIGGEISKLVDQGYQKLLKTSKTEIAATSDHLAALHDFAEELKEGVGGTSLYNESLGTVSETYQYDRVKDRDETESARPKRPWQARGSSSKKKPA